MAEPRRIVAAPVRLCREPRFSQLAMAVAGDALVRRAWSVGKQAELVLPVLDGDLGVLYAFERELGREGHDRATLAAEEYQSRLTQFGADCRAAMAKQFATLGVTAEVVEVCPASPEVVRATRTAFVTLYEQGLIELAERVVHVCPRCRTPLAAMDIEEVEFAAERLTLRLVTDSGFEVEIGLQALELLPGVVAIAVAEDHPAVGLEVLIPIADRSVPVIGTAGATEPSWLVPAHDPDAYALASGLGLAVVPVFDDDGAVCVPGPLAGLGRYAARAAARDLLVSEALVVAADAAIEVVTRCSCCGTPVVPQVGRHWFLRSGDLERAAADAVRDGDVTFTPPEAREAFLVRAGLGRDWCLSSTLTNGVAVPVAVCLECGGLTVDTEAAGSCGACMGEVVAQATTLDARFVAAVWALGLLGWPAKRGGESPAGTSVLATGDDLGDWVLPALALGLRLAGSPPFRHVIVHPWPWPDEPSLAGFLEPGADRRVLRLALVAGTGDVEAARTAILALDEPIGPSAGDPLRGPVGDASEAAAAGVAALGDDMPAMAAGLLASALTAGVAAEAAERVRALAVPILGD